MNNRKKWEKKSGNGIWTNFKNKETGEESIKHHDLTRRVKEYDCKNHYWDLVDEIGNIKCRVCGLGQRIVWGEYIVKDGQVIKTKKM